MKAQKSADSAADVATVNWEFLGVDGPSSATRARIRRCLNSQRCLRALMQVVPAQLLRRHKKESLVRVIWVSDFEMRKLNRQFRGKDKVTDVLSFSCDEPGVLGELVLSWSQIRRQAHEFQVLASDEALFLILHGYLHLLGMDHERGERQARKMFAIQLGLLEILRPDAKGLKDGAFHRVI